MTMAIRKGEGADSILLRFFAEALGRHNAVIPEKMQAVREDYILAVNRDPKAIRNPQEYNRHVGQVLKASMPTEPEPTPAAPPPPAVDRVSADLESLGFSDDDFGLNNAPLEPENPYTKTGGDLDKCAEEWTTKKGKFPYFRVIRIGDKRYGVVGTALIHMADGVEINVGATSGNWKKIQDADETVLVYHNGRQVTISRDMTNDANGSTGPFWVRLVLFKPGRDFRFWINRKENGVRKDVRVARVAMVDSDTGYRVV